MNKISRRKEKSLACYNPAASASTEQSVRTLAGAATRTEEIAADSFNNWDENQIFETSARLFKTSGGKYVVGIEVGNKTEDRYEFRNGVVTDSLESLAENCDINHLSVG
jgi:hypothetical protein